ncbi:GNAT family N-acetyltransferase [Oscillibacter sp.]|uniref:GNAT family N-acetyltransferase n=1 Tax=Oscillibacter sp. TaxID=1945593 RepID=UPI0028A6411E|nr:GNAT family N-acetyltransferase [Oscillibacter sp.]
MSRNKEFDENVALQKAIELFWKQGYEKTSMSDLVEHMGIHRKSLYDTFGDKRELYLKAIQCYGKSSAERFRAVISDAATAKQAIQDAFDEMIEGNKCERSGCFFVNAANELAPRDGEADKIVNQAFLQMEQGLFDIIRKGQESGEIPCHQDARIWAEFLQNTLIGIRVLARTSASKDKLYRIKEMFLELLFNGIEIRKFQTGDLEEIMKIWLDTNIRAHCFVPEDYWKSNFEMVKGALPCAEVYVCEIRGEIKAFLGIDSGYIAGIFVSNEAQSTGIGKRLLDKAKALYPKLSLSVYQKNERAVRFYQREGFAIEQEQMDENTGEAEYRMVWTQA